VLRKGLMGAVTAMAFALGSAGFAESRAGAPASYAGPAIIEEVVSIPARDGAYRIAATIVRPEGPGPYGAVVLNHGVPVSREQRAKESSTYFRAVAEVFAQRGYAVVLPLRRGFGATGGAFAEDAGSCAKPNYRRAEQAAAEDVMAAYNYARTLPYIDASRMILAGQSAGGFVSIFTAGTRSPEGLVAVLSFAGGRGGNPHVQPGVPCAVEPVAQLFDQLGAVVRVPVLFHYAENDLFFNAETSRFWFKRFAAGGANAEYVLQPAFGRDGHYIFGDRNGVSRWLPVVERFLGQHNVPFAIIEPHTVKPMIAVEPAAAPMPAAPDSTPRPVPAGLVSSGGR
jgi:dienelactone hydrolase